MRKFALMLVILMSTYVVAQTTTPVTFRVNMGVQVLKQAFTIATDTVTIRGSFQADAGDPGGNWQGKFFAMTKNANDTIYTKTVSLPKDSSYEFKFVKVPDGWEGSPNRQLTVGATAMILPVYWFNDDSVFVTQVTNTINFTADLRPIYGSGIGYFDPTQDSIIVAGLDWDGLGVVVSGNRRLVEDPFTPGVFSTSMTIRGTEGDSTKWKFRAYPETRFTNTGWETGQDRWFTYIANGSTTTLPYIVPNIYPTIGPLTVDVNVLFQVRVPQGAVNAHNGQVIPIAQIQWIGVKGGSAPIGNWSGNWVAADTTQGYILVMNDQGQMGDKVAGDGLWSRNVVFPIGTPAGAIEYKYAVSYPGADTANGGSSPLDNEGGFGLNHIVILRQPGPIEINNLFGVFTDVKENANLNPESFDLQQNFPNPFNPTTSINYVVPKAGMVSLKVYNSLGEEVATLINQFQNASGYTVNFDASRLSSGVYFYTLRAGDFVATKKMVLMK